MRAAAAAWRSIFSETTRRPEHFAREAARQAIVQLDAVPAPAGEMTVVLGPGWPGILLHEAVGHGLEADFNRKKVSAFSDRIGQQVASPLCTVIDDGTIRNRRGSLNVDDEGAPTQKNVLIEKGVLRGYLFDKLSSRLLRSGATGNGRRESYQHIPMPRMTNTFMLAGESDPGRDHPVHSARALLRQFRRRPSGHHQRQFRVQRIGELLDRGRPHHAAGPRRHVDRQRPGSAQIRQHGRQRSEAGRRHRHLRQRRAERSGGRRNSDHQGRSHDRRRHLRMIDAELASKAVRLALDRGATDAECTLVGRRRVFGAGVRMRSLETLKDAGSRGAGLRILLGQAGWLVLYLRSIQRRHPQAGGIGARDRGHLHRRSSRRACPTPPSLGRSRATCSFTQTTSTASTLPQRIEQALQTEEAALSADPRITNSEGASFGAYSGERVFANSRGFLGILPDQQLLA